MRLFAALFFVLLTGCATTVPVTASFPGSVPELMKQCEDLKKVEVSGPVSITDLLKVVVANYSLYYQCANKVEGWQDWYNEQKKIFESAK
jgi:hypothetical protein